MSTILPQIQGGPPTFACANLSETYQTKAKAISTLQQIEADISKIIKAILSIKYGWLNIVDALGADVVAAVASAAESMAQSVLAGASTAMSSILEAIFAKILYILLSFPDAIFSLVAIPLEQAQASAIREQSYMSKAQADLLAIRSIMNKWFKGMDGSRFYRQLKEALPLVDNALKDIRQMLSELNINGNDFTFDQAKYNNLLSDINSAITVTKSSSVLLQQSHYTDSTTEKWDNERKAAIDKINAKYTIQQKALDDKYTSDIMQAKLGIKPISVNNMTAADILNQSKALSSAIDRFPGQASNNLNVSIDITKITNKYDSDTKALSIKQGVEIGIAEASINYSMKKALSDISTAGVNLLEAFRNDMITLGNYLTSFLGNIKNAYTSQLSCQQYCNTVYNIRSLIQMLIKYIIELLRGTGAAADLIAQGTLTSAESMLTVVDNMFTNEIANYENDSSKRTGAAKMSATLATGNVMLQTTDALLNGMITASLINLINSHDVLESDNKSFDLFLGRLADIPDWNGNLSIWAVSPLSSVSINPYLQLISDVSAMLVKIPISGFSMNSTDKSDIANMVTDVNNGFKAILDHNNLVIGVLNSYVPFQCPSCAVQLKKLLQNLGLLNTFATALSLADVVGEMANSAGITSNDQIVNLKNCTSYYPDYFSDPTSAAAGELEEANKASPFSFTDLMSKLESFDSSAIKLLAGEKYFNGISVSVTADQLRKKRPTQSTTDNLD
jgi:hypothetical protein